MAGLIDSVKGLFSKGSTPRTRASSADLDLVGPDHMPPGCLAALWELHDSRMPRTPQRIRAVRRAMMGESKAAMAEVWHEADADAEADGPDKYTIPRKTARRLASKKSEIKRQASGLTATRLAE